MRGKLNLVGSGVQVIAYVLSSETYKKLDQTILEDRPAFLEDNCSYQRILSFAPMRDTWPAPVLTLSVNGKDHPLNLIDENSVEGSEMPSDSILAPNDGGTLPVGDVDRLGSADCPWAGQNSDELAADLAQPVLRSIDMGFTPLDDSIVIFEVSSFDSGATHIDFDLHDSFKPSQLSLIIIDADLDGPVNQVFYELICETGASGEQPIYGVQYAGKAYSFLGTLDFKSGNRSYHTYDWFGDLEVLSPKFELYAIQ